MSATVVAEGAVEWTKRREEWKAVVEEGVAEWTQQREEVERVGEAWWTKRWEEEAVGVGNGQSNGADRKKWQLLKGEGGPGVTESVLLVAQRKHCWPGATT